MKTLLFCLCICLARLSFSMDAYCKHALETLRDKKTLDLRFLSLASPELNFNPTPWINTPGSATQVFPRFLGASVRELVLGLPKKEHPVMPIAMKKLGETQAGWLAKQLKVPNAEFEAWPGLGETGQLNWVFARWRRDANSPWHWLSGKNWLKKDAPVEAPILPIRMDPNNLEDKHKIFSDFLQFDNLYQMPDFSQLVWTKDRGTTLIGAWLPPELKDSQKKTFTKPGIAGYWIPQPARHNENPIAFTLKANAGKKAWKETIDWDRRDLEKLPPVDLPLLLQEWPADYVKQYKRRLFEMSGHEKLTFVLPEKNWQFKKRSSAQPNNDLGKMADALEVFYRNVVKVEEIGGKVIRHDFIWRGIKQSNVYVVFDGEEKGNYVAGGDHLDAVFAENIFDETGKRETNEGASDNITATCALMATAEQIKAYIQSGKKLKKGIILTHFTGEEFPSDGIGVMKFFEDIYAKKEHLPMVKDVQAMIIPDFIGFHKEGENIFHINPIATDNSNYIAALGIDAAKKLFPLSTKPGKKDKRKWVAEFIARNNRQNAIFNTDLVTPERLGVGGGVLYNENIDYQQEMVKRTGDPHNHQDSDTAPNVKIEYATDVAKVFIENLFRAAIYGTAPPNQPR